MKRCNKDIGDYGENICIDYLKAKGYKILERNFKIKTGEIDIIAIDKKILCFIEVKSRFNSKFGRPMEAVTISKQHKIYNTAQYYLLKHPNINMNCRFDVIEVDLNLEKSTHKINLIKNAFYINQ
ncbi:YraN family protein [Clostridium bornimense]|uniref:YraN family protein n=1 Tax=Clostridium bornimense TaxID=1216932 RepID=UPI001C124A54|nr:YraN family protein [Clostridium bornimense]MBU5317135.1 YraN family protein [Clostridium bornimense]